MEDQYQIKKLNWFARLVLCLVLTSCQSFTARTKTPYATKNSQTGKTQKDSSEKAVAWYATSSGVRQPAADSESEPVGDALDEKAELKKSLASLSPAERAVIIRQSQVFKKEKNEDISSISVVQQLAAQCSDQSSFQYHLKQDAKSDAYTEGSFAPTTSNTVNYYEWPEVQCQYVPDKKLTGQSPKFKCLTELKNGKSKTLKVKYSPDPNDPTAGAEVIETIIATTAARLMGFPAETYCPVRLTCVDCPSQDPWAKSKRSSEIASSQSYEFPYALLELKEKGYEVTTHSAEKSASGKPEGIAWEELRQVDSQDPARVQKLIDREVWMMWVNFLRHFDADPHNQKIICTDAEFNADQSVKCLKSYVYTHDYGTSLVRMHFNFWNEPILKKQGDLCVGTLDKISVLGKGVGGSPGEGLIIRPSFSEEARLKFLEKIKKITDQQWMDILELAHVEKVTRVSNAEWFKSIKNKIQGLEKEKCPAFSTGKSVLGHL